MGVAPAVSARRARAFLIKHGRGKGKESIAYSPSIATSAIYIHNIRRRNK
jgi:hypothetical protein